MGNAVGLNFLSNLGNVLAPILQVMIFLKLAEVNFGLLETEFELDCTTEIIFHFLYLRMNCTVKPFEDEMKEWEDKLISMQDILDAWLR